MGTIGRPLRRLSLDTTVEIVGAVADEIVDVIGCNFSMYVYVCVCVRGYVCMRVRAYVNTKEYIPMGVFNFAYLLSVRYTHVCIYRLQ